MAAANPLQGEISFETLDGKTYLAVYDVAAVCAMEDVLDRPSVQIVVQCALGRVSYIRAGLWAGLRRHHPKLSLDQVGELMTTIKDRKAVDIVIGGIKAAFPKPDDETDDDGDGDKEADDRAGPPAASGEDGTGKGS